MATEKEEVIFSFTVEQGDALNEMERMKKLIIQTKAEQKELNDAYKKGNITLDEFVKEGVRLEANLKRQQSSYNNVQKSVTGVKTQLDKLIDSNKKISKSFEDTAKEINVAGVNIGSLSSKIASFANPVTAAVGVMGALAAAYTASAAGARDLESATNQLAAASALASNEYGSFIDKLTGGDGTGKDGILSTIAASINVRLFGWTNAIMAKLSADAKRQLQELEITEIESKRAAKEALDQAEEFRRQRDQEDRNLQDRLAAANDVEGFINEREVKLLKVQQDKLKVLQSLLNADKENLELKKAVKLVEFEIEDIREDTEGKRTEALNGVLNLERQIAALRGANVSGLTGLETGTKTGSDFGTDTKSLTDQVSIDNEIQINGAKYLNDALIKIDKDRTESETREAGERFRLNKEVDQAKLDSAAMVSGALANLADEGSEAQKVLAFTSILLDTARAVTGGIAAAQSVPYPGNLVAMASTIATILGAIAQAKSVVGFAHGGYTGPGGKYEPAGIVHKDEYVVPKQVYHSAAGQHHVRALESMRLRGYAEGGVVTASMTNEADNNRLTIRNAMKEAVKSMPAPIVGVKQFTKVANQVEVKENAAKAG